jgi:hypothetical protein
MKTRPNSPRFSSFLSSRLNSTWHLALIASIIFGVAFAVGYTATATAPTLLKGTAVQIPGSPVQAAEPSRFVRPSIHPLERLISFSSAIEPIVNTNKPNYQPGDTALITGSGFLPNETIQLQVVHIDDTDEAGQGGAGHEPWYVTADSFGNFTSEWFVNPDDSAGAMFRLTAVGLSSGLVAETIFTDGSANLDTCANGPVNAPVPCTGASWENGNLNGTKSHYFEGQSVPYRTVFEGLIPGNTYTITIEYDTSQGGSHAFDYLTSFDETEPTPGNNPCTQRQGNAIVDHCDPLVSVTTPIPTDPNVAAGQDGIPGNGDDITPIAGVFTLFNGNTLSVVNPGSAYTLDGSYAGNSSTSITVQFNATAATAVLAWSGHISTRLDWGVANSAIAINGSPYHMRLTGLTCSGNGEQCNVGQQDHQLSADAVFFPIQLTIIKETNPDGAQVKTFDYTATGSNLSPFSLTPANGMTAANTIFNLTDTSARTVTESDPSAAAPQFNLTALSCTQTDGGLGVGTVSTDLGTRTVSFTPKEGQFLSCTFTNTEDFTQTRGQIIVDKVTNPSGDTTSFDFTTTYGSPFSLTDASTPNDSGQVLMPGTYSVSETANSDYVTTATCTSGLGHPADDPSSIDLAAGEVVTCTFTNAKKPKLTVTKIVINDNGGTKQVSDFPLFVDGNSVNSGVKNTFTAGPHTVSETTDPAYTATIGGDCAADGSITLAAGDDKACTITNDDKAAKLIVIKHVINDNGGTATAANFTLDSGGADDSPDNFPGAEAPGTEVTLDAGAYNVTETGPSGYTASFSADCTGSISNGQTKTCTVTNDDQAAKLIVIKHVINDNGGTATAANFTLDAGGANDSPDNFPGAEAPGTEVTLDAGAYNVTETGPSGYAASFSANCSGSIANGETKTCTVTNNDQAAYLIVIKNVVNDNGGTATAANFTLDSGGANDSPDNFPGAAAPGIKVTLNAGAYNVTETGPSGYAASFSADCTGSIANGQTKTCTVTNNDISPTLRVIKDVVPDTDGGLFNLRIDGITAGTGANVGEGGSTGFVPVNAGNHTVSETAGTNTTLSDYVSVIGGDCAANGSVSLALAQNKTCTITNTKKGMAKVIKTVNGGVPTGSHAFTFQLRQGATMVANGTILESAVANAGNGGILNFTTKLVPGQTYQMCEIIMPGWLSTLGTFVPSSFMPPDGVAVNPNVDNSTVCGNFTVSAGELKVFTIDNTPPPGGRALTIGFWKNWSGVCTGGSQKDTLGATLASFPIAAGQTTRGVFIGKLYVDNTCLEAVPILDKREIGANGKKQASDPAYNLAAQLLAAKLNLQAGAGVCPPVLTAINQAQALLTSINFTGTGTYLKKMSAAQAALANCLATWIDDYNNNRLSACNVGRTCP